MLSKCKNLFFFCPYENHHAGPLQLTLGDLGVVARVLDDGQDLRVRVQGLVVSLLACVELTEAVEGLGRVGRGLALALELLSEFEIALVDDLGLDVLAL